MSYAMKPLACNPTRIKGMSGRLIVSHYENNYDGVNRLNTITAQLAELDFAKTPGFVINGLKREELIASNSMILHEIFFASLGDESGPEGEFCDALDRDFGSVDRWRAGKAQGGGSGWGAAHLVAARLQAYQSMGNGPHDDARRLLPDPGARYV
jgi:Fe-Mn family superoxide dismutase